MGVGISALRKGLADGRVGHHQTVDVPGAVDSMHAIRPDVLDRQLSARERMDDLRRVLEEAGLHGTIGERE